MRDPSDVLNYLLGSGFGNSADMVRAGSNNAVWGTVGGMIAGTLFGTLVFPGVGTILGFFIGGLFGASINYGRSD